MVDKEDLYTLKINCKGKKTVGKANKGINVEKIIIGFKNFFKRKELKKKKKRKTPQNCKSPIQGQRFITIKNVTEKKSSKASLYFIVPMKSTATMRWGEETKRKKNPKESTEQLKK